MKLKDVTTCSTTVAHSLSEQIIEEMKIINPNCLISFADAGLNVAIDPLQFPYLQPAAMKALGQAIRANGGRQLVLNSAYRTIAQQYLLFLQGQQNRCNIRRVAQPGKSNHESGLALDVRDFNVWKLSLAAHGWRWFGADDQVHFDFVGSGRNDIRGLSVLAFQRLWNKHNQNDLIKDDGGYGDQTAIRLANSPVKGFGGREEATGNRILRLSQPLMQGDDVRRVQLALEKIGFQLANGADGFYGESTENAVRQFQQQQGLKEVDGRVGPNTLAKLEVANSRQPVIITPRSTGPTPGNPFKGNKGLVFDALKSQGFNNVFQLAAIMGSIQQESSFNPHAREVGPPKQGLGLFQWSFGRKKGMPPITSDIAHDIREQVKFFVHELNTTEKAAGKALRSATNLDQAMHGMKLFERFGIEGNRRKFAKEILAAIT